jgi:hypothetical protein
MIAERDSGFRISSYHEAGMAVARTLIMELGTSARPDSS